MLPGSALLRAATPLPAADATSPPLWGAGGGKTANQVFVSQDGMGQFWFKAATGNEMLVRPDPAMRDCLSK